MKNKRGNKAMSFSSDVKEELSKLENLSNKENVKQELIGYLLSCNTTISNHTIKFSTESEYNINRLSKLLNNCQILEYKIEIQDKNFIITFKQKKLEEKFEQFLKVEENYIDLTSKELQIIKQSSKQGEAPIKALMRGMFLGGGAINNPKKTNQLSIGTNTEKIAKLMLENLKENSIKVKIMKKGENYHIYIKDGEEISKVLAFIGASKAVLEFENMRIEKEMRNKINRIVNCKEANLNKTMNASIEQIEAINKLKKSKKFEQLDEKLKEIAEIRLKNPNANLAQISKMLKEPIGKSGVNYRLKKIVDLSKNI